MTTRIKPFGLLLGLMGNFAMGWGISKLVANGSCGGVGFAPCPESLNSAFLLLIGGIFVSLAGLFVGGGALIFLGIFLSIGIGALVAGLSADDSDTRSFGLVFGGSFAGVPLLLLAIFAFSIRGTRAKLARATSLVASGAKGVGTITEVRDTGMTIDDNPRVEVVMSVAPEDGSAAFERTKTVTVSRIDIPRAGDRFPVWYDRNNPSSWAYGTDLNSGEASPEVRALFAKAAALAGSAVTAAAPATTAAPAGADELAKLGELRAKGVLTDAEFDAAKARLLKS